MADKIDAQILEVVGRQLAQDLGIDRVIVECRGVLFEPQPSQPIGDLDRHCRVYDHQLRRRRAGLARAVIAKIKAVVDRSLEGTMWTPITRRQYSREDLCYGSDLTDAEWAIIAPLLPAEGKTGRPRRWPMRDIMKLES